MTQVVDFGGLAEHDPEAIRCPYPIYTQMREQAAATYVPEIESWVVTRYEEICMISRNPTLFSSRLPTGRLASRRMAAGLKEVMEADPELAPKLARLSGGENAARELLAARVLLNCDPPDHLRQRRLVARAFTPARIRETEPGMRRIVDKLAVQVADVGAVDFVGTFAVPFPLLVIAEWLGVSSEDLPQFRSWSDEVVRTIGNTSMSLDEQQDNLLARYELYAYFAARVADRRRNPTGDLISLVVEATLDDEHLSDPEVLNILVQFLVAGNETTASSLTFAIRTLLLNPNLANRLRSDPSLIPAYIEETLRLDSPVQGLYRIANENTVVGDVPIKAGDSLLLLYASGNRDDRQWPIPDEVDIESASTRQLAFGTGEHACIGATMARAELRIALEVLLERFDMAVPDGVNLDDLNYTSSYLIHNVKELPVEFTSRVR